MKDSKLQKLAPPAIAINILRWFCPDELLEGVLCDFEEQYSDSIKVIGKRRATWKFYWNVIRFFHPSIFFRNKYTFTIMRTGLVKSHFLVAARSMAKYKFYTLINILGLSLGVTFTLLVFLFVKKEMGYDNFHKNGPDIYRVANSVTKKETGEVTSQSAITAVPVGKKLLEEVSSVIDATRYASNSVTVIHDNVPTNEVAYFVDPSFLKIFSFPILKGSEDALQLRNNIAISQTKAEQYFGNRNPIGNTITFNINDTISSFTIQAVIDGKSSESSLAVDFLLPFDAYTLVTSLDVIESFKYGILENYVLLQTGSSVNIAEITCSKVLNFNDKDHSEIEVILQPVNSIHLENSIHGNAAHTDPTKLYIMIGLVFLVFIVSVINFMTLSTGHALVRLKEIGLRKSLGAHKRMLHFQLILESFALSFLASLLGLIFVRLLLPTFNQLTDTNIVLEMDWNIILFILSISFSIALVNGTLQLLTIGNFKVINSLQEKPSSKNRSGLFNQGLVVVQFTISIVLIIGTIIIRSQLHFIQNKNLGFDKNNLIQMNLGSLTNAANSNAFINRIKTEALNNARISFVSASMNNSAEPWTTLRFIQEDDSEEFLGYNLVSYDYLETMGIELVEGTFFNEGKSNPSTDIVVNESLVKHFGWINPLEQQIPGKDFTDPHRIIGVVKDFHFSSLKNNIDPLILVTDKETILDGVRGLSTYVWPPNLYQLYVRFTPGEIPPVIDHLSDVWDQENSNSPFTYQFVDETVAQQYREEKRWGDIINSASIFAIFIAWMGLVGLTRLSVQRRIKEIGIRKVLGSSTFGIASLLSRKFLLIVVLANAIAWPVTHLLAETWLTSFTYRVEIHPFIYVASGLSVIGLVTLSIGLQSLFASKSNPVESLRQE